MNNRLLDYGATAHMTPHVTDFLPDSLIDTNKIVEIADGSEASCTLHGSVLLNMLDDRGEQIQGEMEGVLYIKGLTQRLFSVPTFKNQGHHVLFGSTFAQLFFTTDFQHPVTISLPQEIDHPTAFASTPTKNLKHSRPTQQPVQLDPLYRRLAGRSLKIILAADKILLWEDTNT